MEFPLRTPRGKLPLIGRKLSFITPRGEAKLTPCTQKFYSDIIGEKMSSPSFPVTISTELELDYTESHKATTRVVSKARSLFGDIKPPRGLLTNVCKMMLQVTGYTFRLNLITKFLSWKSPCQTPDS